MKKLVLIAAAGSLALALGACHGNKTEEAPVETNVANITEIDNGMTIVNDTTVAPTPETNVTAAPSAPRGGEFTNTAQTQDDADATGMTARVSRDEDNDTAPAR